MALIPPFQPDGLLPPGDYEVSFEELRASVFGCGARFTQAVSKLGCCLARQARGESGGHDAATLAAGIKEVFADGSFAEDKHHPNDIDGYFVADLGQLRSGELVRTLNRMEPDKIWNWDPRARRPFPG